MNTGHVSELLGLRHNEVLRSVNSLIENETFEPREKEEIREGGLNLRVKQGYRLNLHEFVVLVCKLKPHIGLALLENLGLDYQMVMTPEFILNVKDSVGAVTLDSRRLNDRRPTAKLDKSKLSDLMKVFGN